MAPPAATMAAFTDEAPVVPDAEADGTYVCPDCDKSADSVVRWLLHRAACHGVPLSQAVFPAPTSSDQFRQDFRGVWFRISREGHFFEMTEAHQARSVRKLGPDVVVPLLVKGDKIRLKDGTRLFYGEGFDEESEPEVDVPAASTEPGLIGVEMRDDPDERERGWHQSAPVTPPKAAPPKKAGRNKASRTLSLRTPLLGRPLALEQRRGPRASSSPLVRPRPEAPSKRQTLPCCPSGSAAPG